VGSSAQRLGDHAVIQARLQMHATDPDQLERRLGTAQSKGCIRIPASLNIFLDRFSVLDQDYEQGLDEGRRLWVLRRDRSSTRDRLKGNRHPCQTRLASGPKHSRSSAASAHSKSRARAHRGLDEADMNASRKLRACCIERQPEEAQARSRRG
jgi:hypothetical protein